MKSLFILFAVIFCFWIGYRTVLDIQAEQNYIGYLKRAADANSIELAKTELSKAVSEIERRGLTSGYTSILYKTPDEDIGFWYANLKTSLEELQGLSKNSSSMEKSNVLIKLRESLLDGGDKGDSITYPSGISVYPNNVVVMLWCVLSFVCAAIFFTITAAQNDWFD